jgi:hypothetical protein
VSGLRAYPEILRTRLGDAEFELRSRFLSLMQRLEYKPGTKISFILNRPETIGIKIYFDVKDARTGEPTKLVHDSGLEKRKARAMTDAEIVGWVRECVHRAEQHEADEWLRLDGALVSDPHAGENNG